MCRYCDTEILTQGTNSPNISVVRFEWLGDFFKSHLRYKYNNVSTWINHIVKVLKLSEVKNPENVLYRLKVMIS